jgi:predicted nuclease with TOPRIM domain
VTKNPAAVILLLENIPGRAKAILERARQLERESAALQESADQLLQDICQLAQVIRSAEYFDKGENHWDELGEVSESPES